MGNGQKYNYLELGAWLAVDNAAPVAGYRQFWPDTNGGIQPMSCAGTHESGVVSWWQVAFYSIFSLVFFSFFS